MNQRQAGQRPWSTHVLTQLVILKGLGTSHGLLKIQINHLYADVYCHMFFKMLLRLYLGKHYL